MTVRPKGREARCSEDLINLLRFSESVRCGGRKIPIAFAEVLRQGLSFSSFLQFSPLDSNKFYKVFLSKPSPLKWGCQRGGSAPRRRLGRAVCGLSTRPTVRPVCPYGVSPLSQAVAYPVDGSHRAVRSWLRS